MMDYERAINDLDYENARLKRENMDLTQATNTSMFQNPNEDNLIRWQLDLKEDLDYIYHLLKGDIIVEDENGTFKYKAPDNETSKPFNETGVQMIMNIVFFYLNRNTLLSNYDEKTIYWKVLDFGRRLNDLLFNRYHELMLTTTFEKEFERIYQSPVIVIDEVLYTDVKLSTGMKMRLRIDDDIIQLVDEKIDEHLQEKIKLFPMIHGEIVDAVHSSFLRALNGGERDSLRTARTVIQNNPDRMNNALSNIAGQKRSLWKPSTWTGN